MRLRNWVERHHPRHLKGSDKGGQFRDADTAPGWVSRIDDLMPDTYRSRMLQLNDYIDQHLDQDTSVQHRHDGRWDAERAETHQAIVDEVWAKTSGGVPSERKAVIAGGLMGAGKTTTLRGVAKVDLSKYMAINPDDMKEEIIKRGMYPRLGDPDLSPMETSTLIHQESSHLAQMLAERALAAGKNIAWDASMGDYSSITARVTRLRDLGYQVRGIFVDVPVEVSLARASARYAEGMREYRQGKGFGGRPIPPRLILGQKEGKTSKNRRIFEQVQGLFSEWEIYDNSADTGDAILIDRSKK